MDEPPRLTLARRPTPIQPLPRLSEEAGRELLVWRDDLTGFGESGNKVRKLEYLLAEAAGRGATWLVTCGGPQSNHARCTVLLARQLGMGVSVLVRELPGDGGPDTPWTGNLLLNHIAGARLVPLSLREYREAGSTYDPFLDREAERLRERGEVPYVIGEGGSTPLGCWGYLSASAEMRRTWREQGLGDDGPDALFLALGSGGTHAGLVLGFQAHGLDPARVCAVNVCNDVAYFQKRVGDLVTATAEQYGLERPGAGLNIFGGHVGGGYGKASDDDLRFYGHAARADGLLLDPCYTGKAFRGMLAEIRRDPQRFGRRILFLHSGGVFASFAYAEQWRQVLEPVTST